MTVNIKEYKESIFDMFQNLTQIEIDNVKDVMKHDPEKNSDLGMVYLMAINHCRQILKTILKDNNNGS